MGRVGGMRFGALINGSFFDIIIIKERVLWKKI
jgi:hypothetical protein